MQHVFVHSERASISASSSSLRVIGFARMLLAFLAASTTAGIWESVKPDERPAPVAQRIEHLTTDQKVGGSNPSGCASILPSQGNFFDWGRSQSSRTRPVDSNADSNAVQFGWTKTRSMASAASRSAVGMTWE